MFSMPKYLSTNLQDFQTKSVDSTLNIGSNKQSTFKIDMYFSHSKTFWSKNCKSKVLIDGTMNFTCNYCQPVIRIYTMHYLSSVLKYESLNYIKKIQGVLKIIKNLFYTEFFYYNYFNTKLL